MWTAMSMWGVHPFPSSHTLSLIHPHPHTLLSEQQDYFLWVSFISALVFAAPGTLNTSGQGQCRAREYRRGEEKVGQEITE